LVEPSDGDVAEVLEDLVDQPVGQIGGKASLVLVAR
jgi:hypothetical protein